MHRGDIWRWLGERFNDLARRCFARARRCFARDERGHYPFD